MKEYKPWEEYPEFWKTEAAWWSYLRGGLRRGLWEKSPIKLDFKNKACHEPPEGYTGRAKSGAICALTGDFVGKSKSEVDHIEGHMSLTCWEDVLPFIMHLAPPKGSLQLVEKEAHKIKSYAERVGITYEEAVIEKDAIAWEKRNKGVKKQRDILQALGVEGAQDLKGKDIRKAYVEYLKSKQENLYETNT